MTITWVRWWTDPGGYYRDSGYWTRWHVLVPKGGFPGTCDAYGPHCAGNTVMCMPADHRIAENTETTGDQPETGLACTPCARRLGRYQQQGKVAT